MGLKGKRVWVVLAYCIDCWGDDWSQPLAVCRSEEKAKLFIERHDESGDEGLPEDVIHITYDYYDLRIS